MSTWLKVEAEISGATAAPTERGPRGSEDDGLQLRELVPRYPGHWYCSTDLRDLDEADIPAIRDWFERACRNANAVRGELTVTVHDGPRFHWTWSAARGLDLTVSPLYRDAVIDSLRIEEVGDSGHIASADPRPVYPVYRIAAFEDTPLIAPGMGALFKSVLGGPTGIVSPAPRLDGWIVLNPGSGYDDVEPDTLIGTPAQYRGHSATVVAARRLDDGALEMHLEVDGSDA